MRITPDNSNYCARVIIVDTASVRGLETSVMNASSVSYYGMHAYLKIYPELVKE